VLACAVPLAASAATPRHVVEQARSGALRAVLSYLDTPQKQSYVFEGKMRTFTTDTDSDFRLSLTRSGRLLFNRLLGCDYCQPGGLEADHPEPSIHFDRLAAGGSPEALLDLYTGGAHCCFLTDFLLIDGSRVRMIQEAWGDPGYRLEALGGAVGSELVSADDRFAYEFTDYADSVLPIKILRLDGSALADVTRSYPREVEADAGSLWSLYLKTRAGHDGDVRGILAAWAADEALLGRWSHASAGLALALARGDLDHGPTLDGWPNGQAYLTALHKFLIKTRYL
jgi:hypothetical protein